LLVLFRATLPLSLLFHPHQISLIQDSSRISQRRYFISTEKYQLHKPAILNENAKQGNRLISPKTLSAKRNKKQSSKDCALAGMDIL
jgi:hypothetical protein